MPSKPLFFPSPAAWRRWLTANHSRCDELWVGFYKRATGTPSITWPESVDEALCFGWIDGLRKRIDDDRYMIRFTPRRRGSIWSAINVKRVAELIKTKRMRPEGLRAYALRDERKTAIYSFERRQAAKLSPAYLRQFKANVAAWTFFSAQPPWYQRIVAFYVMDAKREETRARRLERAIDDSAQQRRIGLVQSRT
jgi:uncharacterized protein YdeI (YjbR/CyaY-like superfamily)